MALVANPKYNPTDPNSQQYIFDDPANTVINAATGQKASTLAQYGGSSSPTVISNARVIEEVIPKLEERTNNLAKTGMYTDQEGTMRYADDQPVPEEQEEDVILNDPLTGEERRYTPQNKDSVNFLLEQGWERGEGDPYQKKQNDLINEMKASLDAQTKRQIDAIEQMFAVRKQQQAEIDRRAGEGIKQTLHMGGSSRYAQISSTGIIQAKETAALLNIAELDAEEKALVNSAMAARDAKNFQLLEKQLDLAEKKREEKQEAAAELAKTIAEENKKLKEKMIQASRDGAIGNLIDQGVTDPSRIIDYLNYDDEGNLIGDFTADEIKKTLDLFAPQIERKNMSNIGDAISMGAKTPIDVYRLMSKRGQQASLGQISEIMKKMNDTEKTYPGIIGEWMGAIESGAIEENTGLDDYLNMKDPARAYAVEEKKLQIDKLKKEIEKMDDPPPGAEPENLLAYAQQYAATGQIPPGLPKGTFGIVSQFAKEIPKATGTIVSKTTGVTDTKSGAAEQADFGKLYNILNNITRLKELDQKRMGGVVGGFLGSMFDANDQNAYLMTRKAIVDDMSRMQSGAALTPAEIANYETYLPGKYSDTPGWSNIVGQDSQQRIENFRVIIDNRLRERLDANGLSMYGYSEVNIGGKKYKVGDIVQGPGGKTGRVLPDGTITVEEDTSQSFKSVGNTKASNKKEIIAGYDITSYATDPTHGKKIEKIYTLIPTPSSPRDVDSYIRSVAPYSPVRGEDVIAAAKEYNVDPKLMLAIMQQDSTFGTKGKAVRTYNPGNVGNTDDGSTRNFGDWRTGVFAVAKNLSKRKG